MKLRVLFSILLNVLAVAGPAAVLYLVYGMGATVDANSGRDLVALLSTGLFSFATGLGAATLVKSVDKSFLLKIVEGLMDGKGTTAGRHRRKHA